MAPPFKGSGQLSAILDSVEWGFEMVPLGSSTKPGASVQSQRPLSLLFQRLTSSQPLPMGGGLTLPSLFLLPCFSTQFVTQLFPWHPSHDTISSVMC